jgi:hypothetical protein
MYKLQLGDNLFVDIDNEDLFIYKYDDNHFAVKTVKDDYHLPVNEYAVEILSFYSKRHFLFKRQNGAY